ncbi:helix-turn-helix transcriptional regulator [Pseudoxanthomonas wuyuanensis]
MDNRFSRSGQGWSDTPLSIGAAVRQARRSHGLTQTQLAGLAGTGLRFISELERGKPSVALDKTLAVLAVLGLRLQISTAKP